MTTFKVGDRVCRPRDLDRSSLKRGTVVEVYRSATRHAGESDTLYAVKWDDLQSVERSYLILEPEPLSIFEETK